MSIRMWKGKSIKGEPKVSLVVASYLNDDPRRFDSLMCLLYSIKAQTYPHWKVYVLHDGPMREDLAPKFLALQENRFRILATAERKGQFGHPWRKFGIDMADGDYIGLSNDDNYYAPVYFEWMLHALQHKHAQLVYCDMVHSHRGWGVIHAEPKRGFIDAGNWLVEAQLAKSTPWTDMGFAGDWTYFDRLRVTSKRVAKVAAPLFVHN